MKIPIIVSLYLLGTFLTMLWFTGDKEAMSEFNKHINEDPDLASSPEAIVRIVAFFALFVSCMTWPYSIISAPIIAFRNKKKKENKK